MMEKDNNQEKEIDFSDQLQEDRQDEFVPESEKKGDQAGDMIEEPSLDEEKSEEILEKDSFAEDDSENELFDYPEDISEGGDVENEPKKTSSFFQNIKAKGAIQDQFSTVAAAPSHKKIMALVLIGAIGLLIYLSFFLGSKTEEEKKSDYEASIKKNKDSIIESSVPVPKAPKETVVVESPKLPDAPQLVDPTPPSPPPLPIPEAPPSPIIDPNRSGDGNDNAKESANVPPPPSSMGQPVTVTTSIDPFGKDDEEKKKLLEAKRKAGIMVFGGSSGLGGKKDSSEQDKDKDADSSAASNNKTSSSFLGFGEGAFDGNSLARSDAASVEATIVKNLDRTIVQGKIIYAILETAINTDLPGTLRAVIARDVYAELGRNVLIPKGSRLIGSYDSAVKAGQTRVGVVWDRVIRPDGVDIKIGSAGVDNLGRAGVRGQLDSKFWTRLATAFLISYAIPIVSAKISGVGDEQVTTSTTPGTDGNTTTSTTGSAKGVALQDSASDFSDLMEDAVNETFTTKPTITIDQGTRINILVQKDLVFPASAVRNSR